MKSSRAVLCTTVFATDPEDGRFVQALRTAEEARVNELHLYIVSGCPNPICDELLRERGAEVVKEVDHGMGASRRQGIREVVKKYDPGAVVWLEPEKYPLVAHLEASIQAIGRGQADLVVPRRTTLESYPKYQELSELRANHAMGAITSRGDLDLMFGPRVMGRKAIPLFLAYGPEYGGDQWHVLFAPVVWAIKKGLKLLSVTVPYVHPLEQTTREEGNAEMDSRRDIQRVELIELVSREMKRS